MASESVGTIFTRGLWDENPVFKLLLGLCPALAVTATALDGAGMGACSTFVLVCSNVVVAILKPIIPSRMRLPCFIVVIASFVTIVDLVVAAYFISLSKSLGIFIPLIVVNCLILGRAEAYASKNPIWTSAIDGIGMGIGFTLALTAMGVIREILGNGSVFGFEFGRMLFGDGFAPLIVMILPPGAFLTLGYMIAFKVMIDRRRAS